MRIGQKHLDQLFAGQNELTQGQNSKKRPVSAAPLYRHGDGKNDIKLTFNAKDKNQLRLIQHALKVEQQRSDGEMRPSTRTFADSDGQTHSAIGPDRFKSHFTSSANEPDVGPITLTNQRNVQKDDRLTLNAFNQENGGMAQEEMANYRNLTVSPNQLPNLIAQGNNNYPASPQLKQEGD